MAPASNTTDTPTWNVTSTSWGSSARRLPLDPLPPASPVARLVREACHAGSAPKTKPLRIVAARAKKSVVGLIPTPADRGRPGGARRSSESCSAHAMATPAMPATPDTTPLSVRICRSRRARPAPMAVLTASSRSRTAARLNANPATFAAAATKTRPAAASNKNRVGPMSPTTHCESGRISTLLCWSGRLPTSSSMPPASARRSCSAIAGVTPGSRRAMMLWKLSVRLPVGSPMDARSWSPPIGRQNHVS